MLTIGIKQLLSYTPMQIHRGFKGLINLRFDDGKVIQMNDIELVVHRYIFELAIVSNIDYVPSTVYIGGFYKNGIFNDDVLRNSLTVLSQHIIRSKVSSQEGYCKEDLDGISVTIINILCNLFNEFLYKLTRYIVGFDMNDILKIQLEPTVVEAMLVARESPTEKNISRVYNTITEYMSANPRDVIPMMIFSKALKINQFHIMVGPRGGISEINGVPYLTINTNSFFMGLDTAHGFFQESRTAVTALIAQKRAIQESENLAKILQTFTSITTTVTYNDCGSTELIDVNITSDNLPKNRGRYYVDDKQTLQIITPETDHHLIGTTVRMRTPLGCKQKQGHTICLVCMGSIALNIPKHVNIGHLSGALFGAIVTSGHLAKKHHLGSTFGSTNANLNEEQLKFFYSKGNELLLADPIHAIRVTIDSVMGLMLTPDLANQLDIRTLSKLDDLTVVRNIKGIEITDDLNIKIEGRSSFMTKEFLDYARLNHIVTGKYIEINMENFDISIPLLNVVNKAYNFMALTDELGLLLIHNKSPKKKNQFTVVPTFRNTIVDLLNSKLDMQTTWIDIMLIAFLKERDSGRVPNTWEEAEVVSDAVANDRSLTPAIGYIEYANRMINPKFYLNKPFSHVSDVLMVGDAMFKISPTPDQLII